MLRWSWRVSTLSLPPVQAAMQQDCFDMDGLATSRVNEHSMIDVANHTGLAQRLFDPE